MIWLDASISFDEEPVATQQCQHCRQGPAKQPVISMPCGFFPKIFTPEQPSRVISFFYGWCDQTCHRTIREQVRHTLLGNCNSEFQGIDVELAQRLTGFMVILRMVLRIPSYIHSVPLL